MNLMSFISTARKNGLENGINSYHAVKLAFSQVKLIGFWSWGAE